MGVVAVFTLDGAVSSEATLAGDWDTNPTFGSSPRLSFDFKSSDSTSSFFPFTTTEGPREANGFVGAAVSACCFGCVRGGTERGSLIRVSVVLRALTILLLARTSAGAFLNSPYIKFIQFTNETRSFLLVSTCECEILVKGNALFGIESYLAFRPFFSFRIIILGKLTICSTFHHEKNDDKRAFGEGQRITMGNGRGGTRNGRAKWFKTGKWSLWCAA